MKSFVHRYHLLAIFSLFLVLIFFYFPVLFLGRTLQGPEMARVNQTLKSPPLNQDILNYRVAPQIFNTEQVTAAYFEFPYTLFFGRLYRRGELPLWNSHQGLGLPVAAQYESSVFFPLRILQNISPPSMRDWFFILQMWLAGIFTYGFFITVGLNRISALWGACLYIGCGVFSWFMQLEDFMGGAMMLPLLMIIAHQLATKFTRKLIAFLGITTGLTLLNGLPEPIFYSFVLVGCYFIYKSFSISLSLHQRLLRLGSFSLGIILGFMIASPMLFLFAQLFRHSFSIHSDTLHNLRFVAGLKARTPAFLLSGIALPQLLDWPIMPLTTPAAGSWDFLGSYIGVISLFFLFVGFQLHHKVIKNDYVFFTLIGVVFLLMNLGFWPFNLIGYLPVFRQAWGPRWAGAAWSFSFIAASTYGFYLIQTAAHDFARYKRIINVSLIGVAIVFYLCIAVTATRIHIFNYYIINLTQFIQPWTQIFISMGFAVAALFLQRSLLLKHYHQKYCWVASLFISIVLLWYMLPKGNFLLPVLSAHFTPGVNFVLTRMALLVLALALLAVIQIYIKCKIKLFIFLGLLIFTATIFYSIEIVPGYPKYRATEKPTPFITYLQKKAEYNRIFSLDGIIMPSYASLYGLYDARFLIPMSYYSYQHFVETYIKEQPVEELRHWFDAKTYASVFSTGNQNENIVKFRKDFPKAISLLSVKYFITQKSQDYTWMQRVYPNLAKQLVLVYSDNAVNIYKNMLALPRLYVVAQYQFANTYEQAQAMAMNDHFDIYHTAVLNTLIPEKNSTEQPLASTVHIVSYKNTKVIIHCATNQQSLLVLTDMYYPGWRATVDGKNTKIVQVNGLMRGVFISKGKHTVQFYYFPSLFKYGLVLMIISLCICVILIVFDKRRVRCN